MYLSGALSGLCCVSPPFVKDTTSRYSASAVDSLFSPVTSSFVVDSFMA